MSKGIWLTKDMLNSKAFRSLKAPSLLILLDFLGKRRLSNLGGKRKRWVITNNGEIEYTFSEAKKKGFTTPRFNRGRDEIIEKGFLDIAHKGSGGIKGDKTLYFISERWRKFGTSDFVVKNRSKDTRKGRGWALYHSKRNDKSNRNFPEPLYFQGENRIKSIE